MNYNRVAFRYAKALLLSCKDDNDKLEEAHSDMSFINCLLYTSPSPRDRG